MLIKSSVETTRPHIIVFALYMLLLPIATSLSGIIGNVSLLNYVAIIYIGLYVLRNLDNTIVYNKKTNAIFLYFVFVMFSTLYNFYSVAVWQVTTFASNGIIALLATTDTYTSNELKLIKKSIVLSSIIAIFVTLLNIESALNFRLTITISSTMDSNDFACGLVIILSLLLTMITRNNNRILAIVLFSCCCGIIILSGSRGAMIMTIAIICAWLFQSIKSKRVLIPLVLVLFITFLFIYFYEYIPEYLKNRLSIFALLEDGGSGRSKIWLAAINEFFDGNLFELLFGSGYGSFRGRVHYIAHGHSGAYESHNMWINLLIEGGVVGIVLLIWTFMQTYKIAKSQKNMCGMIALTGLAIAGSTLDFQAYRVFWMVFIIAIIFKEDEIYENKPAGIGHSSRFQRRKIHRPMHRKYNFPNLY